MNAGDIAQAISAMERAAMFIRGHVPFGTEGKPALCVDLEFTARRLRSELGQFDVEIKDKK